MKSHKLLILGTRGIPGKHGGFETFAERLALYLVKRGWEVTVYCQSNKDKFYLSNWQGINLVHIPAPNHNALWSIWFDFKATLHALNQEGIILTLGYNTAIFSFLYSLNKRVNITNMDGMEWWRGKWNALEKAWLYINERCGIWFSDCLIADHPQIKKYLLTKTNISKPIAVIPYGAEPVINPDEANLKKYNLVPGKYIIVIARPEPENSILEIVSAFSQKRWDLKLVVLGHYFPQTNPYHKKVMETASEEVIFPGGIYEKQVVEALRFYARLYIHGHQVGGTNPSLVEALAAGTPVLAHDNRFNYWVAGEGSHYFQAQADCFEKLERILNDELELNKMRKASFKRYKEAFSDNQDLKAYEDLFKLQIKGDNSQKYAVKSFAK
jgi:glycosyltransferase involved in cell wall biosynthesis